VLSILFLKTDRSQWLINLTVPYTVSISFQVYFINHRYDGIQLWQVQGITGIHELVWISSFISFFFLYPSTFNLLEVAAVDKPKLHMWETGIMRITRHPQVISSIKYVEAFSMIALMFLMTTYRLLTHNYPVDGWAGNLVPCSYTMDWQLSCRCSLCRTYQPPSLWCLEW